MKRTQLLRHLRRYHCFLLREGGRHSIYFNPRKDRTSSIPRHREINKLLARKICHDLGIPTIRK